MCCPPPTSWPTFSSLQSSGTLARKLARGNDGDSVVPSDLIERQKVKLNSVLNGYQGTGIKTVLQKPNFTIWPEPDYVWCNYFYS